METFIDEQFDRIYAYWVSADTGTYALYVQPLVLGREHVYVCVCGIRKCSILLYSTFCRSNRWAKCTRTIVIYRTRTVWSLTYTHTRGHQKFVVAHNWHGIVTKHIGCVLVCIVNLRCVLYAPSVFSSRISGRNMCAFRIRLSLLSFWFWSSMCHISYDSLHTQCSLVHCPFVYISLSSWSINGAQNEKRKKKTKILNESHELHTLLLVIWWWLFHSECAGVIAITWKLKAIKRQRHWLARVFSHNIQSMADDETNRTL